MFTFWVCFGLMNAASFCFDSYLAWVVGLNVGHVSVASAEPELNMQS